MLTTVALVAAQLLILTIFGWAALALVGRELRDRLLPAAPIFGAALIAVVTNWTTRWWSIKAALPIIVAIPLLIVVLAVVRSRRDGSAMPWIVPRRALAGLAASIAVCSGGLVLAATPVMIVGDTNIVSATGVPDGLYFAEVSTWAVDNPVLPGPRVNDSLLVNNDPPAAGAAADTVTNRLRYGQSSVAAVLAVLVGHDPYNTLVSNSLLWLALLGVAIFVGGRLVGMSRGWSLAAAAVVSNLFFVVTQTLNGQNDGLLGGSVAILAVVMAGLALRERAAFWPATLLVAGLVTIYYEYATMVVPAMMGLMVFGGLRGLLHRINTISGVWATAFALAPWAWIWAAQSLATTSRLSSGQSAFEGKTGWSLLRTYAGVATFQDQPAWNAIFGVVAVLAVLAVAVGLLVAIRHPELRAVTAGVVGAFVALQVLAALRGSTNLQYRVIQLGLPLVILFAAYGWDRIWRARPRPGSRDRLAPATLLVSAAAAGLVLVAPPLLAAANFTTVAVTTSHDRARNQHVPAEFTTALHDLVDRVGGSELTVVTPVFPDAVGISLSLMGEEGVVYADVPYPGITQVGSPNWDGKPDPYYALGRGVTVYGDVEVVAESGPYKLVKLGPSGTIVAPLGTAEWQRLTQYGRGSCAAPNARVLVIRGSKEKQALRISSSPNVADLADDKGTRLRVVRHERRGSSNIQVVRLPSATASILSLGLNPPRGGEGNYWSMQGFSDPAAETDPLATVPESVVSICLAGFYNGVDGYDRESFTMTSPY